jgi:hypothetical protein
MNVRSKLFYGYVTALIIYSAFTLLPEPSAITMAQYHLGVIGLRIIYATFIVILAAIWYIGFYGYEKLQSYSRLIAGGKDHKPVAWLKKGIFVIALWLPVSSVISSILKYIASHHVAMLPAITIIDNYISLLLPLIAFFLLSKGARGLSDLTRQRPTFGATNLLTAAVIYLGLIDYHLVISTHDRAAVYHMSLWFILTTLVAPYIYMWYIGIMTTYEIYQYRLKVQGIVYRSSWTLLSLGIGWLIVTSIGLQYLTTITNRLTHVSIYWLLIIIYALLLVLSIGFILIAAGTRKLRRIEEV